MNLSVLLVWQVGRFIGEIDVNLCYFLIVHLSRISNPVELTYSFVLP